MTLAIGMFWGLLFWVTLIGIPVLFIMIIISLFKKDGKLKKRGIMFLACLVLMPVSAFNLSSSREKHLASTPPAAPAAPAAAVSYETHIVRSLGKSNLPDYKDRLLEIKDLGDTIEILFIANDNLTENLFETSILKDSWKIVQIVFDDPDLQHYELIALRVYFPTIDTYGNKQLSRIGHLLIEREEYNKINKANFRYDSLPKIAVSYGLRKS